jgi:hypothetical protein
MSDFNFTAVRWARWPSLVLVAWLVGCAQVSQVASGTTTVRGRLVVDVADDWNQFERGPNSQATTWTHEGVFVDALQFFVGIKDGELIAPTPPQPPGIKPLAFKAAMQSTEVAELFQSLAARDGSAFTLDKIEATTFLGGPGFRFEYTLVRKFDEVRLRGVAWGAVRQGELFLVNFSAPRLTFFDRFLPKATAIAASARVKN